MQAFFEQAIATPEPHGPHGVWEELIRRHESDRTVPAHLVEREPRGWIAEVFGVRAVLLDDAVAPALRSCLEVGATIDAWILKWNIDRGELFLYFVDKGPSAHRG